MVWQYNPYTLPLFFGGFLSLGLALFMWRRRRFLGVAAFAALLLSTAEWALTGGVEYVTSDLPSVFFWEKATFVGGAIVPVAYLVFVLIFTGRSKWLKSPFLWLAYSAAFATVLLACTNEAHHLIYTQIGLTEIYGLSALNTSYGYWFYVYLAYSYVAVFLGIVLLIRFYSRSQSVLRRQAAVVMVGAVVPLAASILDVSPTPVFPLPFTPLAFTFSAAAIFWAVFRSHVFELTPVARETIVRGMDDGVVILDSNDRLVDINPAGERFLGSRQKITGNAITEILENRGMEGRYVATDSSEISLLVDGVQRYFDLNFSSLRNKQGDSVGRIGVMREITDRKRMEDALRESEARFRELADLLPQIVFETDARGRLTYFNQVGVLSTGYNEKDLRKGFDAAMAFPPEEVPKVMDAFSKVLGGAKRGPIEYNLRRKDGSTFPVMIHSSAIIREGKPVGLRGIIIDVSHQKKMEQRLLQAEHLAAIGETASMVAHDLRNPLQGIAVATYLLRSEGISENERNEMIDLIENNVEYSDGIVKDLLDYSRTFQLELVEVTPNKIISSALKTVQIPENIEVQNNAQEQPLIAVDPDRMKRVFVNLIENAVDAMPWGGILSIKSLQSRDWVEIAFSDTGTGLAKGAVENLWKPLQTTKAKGMGMGLAICKRLVDAHGGEIRAESKNERGTTFTVRLRIKPILVSVSPE